MPVALVAITALLSFTRSGRISRPRSTTFWALTSNKVALPLTVPVKSTTGFGEAPSMSALLFTSTCSS